MRLQVFTRLPRIAAAPLSIHDMAVRRSAGLRSLSGAAMVIAGLAIGVAAVSVGTVAIGLMADQKRWQFTTYGNVAFGSLAEHHDTAKAAVRTAGIGGQADVAIREYWPRLAPDRRITPALAALMRAPREVSILCARDLTCLLSAKLVVF